MYHIAYDILPKLDAKAVFSELEDVAHPQAYFENAQQQTTVIVSKTALVLKLKDSKFTLNTTSKLGEKLKRVLDSRDLNMPPQSRVTDCQDQRLKAADIFDAPRKLLKTYPTEPSLPPIARSLLGILGFESCQYFENLQVPSDDPFDFPDFCFYYPQEMVMYDKGTMYVIAFDTTQQKAKTALAALKNKIQRVKNHQPKPVQTIANTAATTQDNFIQKVKQIQSKIHQGDLFQCVLARRFSMGLKNPLDAFFALINQNPSPYHFYAHLDSHCVFGASPESAVRVQHQAAKTLVHICPLAGTQAKDCKQPLTDKNKDMAEHMMLVDLARNDLARICKPGTRQVVELAKAVDFNHIQHLRSKVQGELREDLDGFHALKVCLPMGTLSGAPKIHAIQSLMALEGQRRGPYGGTIGLFGANGDVDTSIIIRSAIVHHQQAHIVSGAGVVKDSVPEDEFEETELKASRLKNLLSGAQL